MPPTSDFKSAFGCFAAVSRAPRIILGVLLAANLIAAGLVLYPPGGSADSLERQVADLQSRAAANRWVSHEGRLSVQAEPVSDTHIAREGG